MMNIPVWLAAIAALLASSQAGAGPASLKTRSVNEIGLSLSSYQYHEPGLMSLSGFKMGLDLGITKSTQEGRFIRGDLRLAGGTVDYNSNGTGSANGEPDLYVETRGLIGTDRMLSGAVLSPYIGLGYRYLYNDARGISSSGAAGYRRESNYYYLPIGAIYRVALHDQARWISTLEYDYLLAGKQVSHLSDVPGYSDITNHQNSGYGLKLGIMYQQDKWMVGPCVNYWNISESEVVYAGNTGWVEPANNTIEFGLKFAQQF